MVSRLFITHKYIQRYGDQLCGKFKLLEWKLAWYTLSRHTSEAT